MSHFYPLIKRLSLDPGSWLYYSMKYADSGEQRKGNQPISNLLFNKIESPIQQLRV